MWRSILFPGGDDETQWIDASGWLVAAALSIHALHGALSSHNACKMSNGTDELRTEGRAIAAVDLDMSALDGLRGTASLHILIYHYLRNTWIDNRSLSSSPVDVYASSVALGWDKGARLTPPEWDLMGELVVLQFYFISGFVLSLAYRFAAPREPEAEALMDVTSFYVKRLARIMPLYYFTNIIGEAVAATDPFWSMSGDRKLLFMPLHRFPRHELILVGLGSLLPNNMPPNAPSWTISVFLVCYLVYPPVAMSMPPVAPSRAHLGARACLALYALAVPLVSTSAAGFGAAYNWAPTQLPLFFAGAFGAIERRYELSEPRRSGTMPETTGAWSAGSAAAAYALAYSGLVAVNATWMDGDRQSEALKRLGLVVIAPLAMRLVCSLAVERRPEPSETTPSESVTHAELRPHAHAEPRPATHRPGEATFGSTALLRFLRSRPLKHLGDLSLSIYLLQMPVARAVRWAADLMICPEEEHAGGAASLDRRLRPCQLAGSEGLQLHCAFGRCLVATVITLCASHAALNLVERPAARAILDAYAKLQRRNAGPNGKQPVLV